VGDKHPQWKGGISNQQKVCIVCKKEFTSSYAQKCCSPNCKGKYYTLNGLKSGKNNGMYKGGRIASGAGYIKILMPEHPNANKRYVLEHHLVIEKQIGRYLIKGEVVHHKNEIKNDNRIENLQLMTRQEHDRHHFLKRKKAGTFVRVYYEQPIKIKCQFCGKEENRHYFREKITCKSCQYKQNKIRQKRWEEKQRTNEKLNQI
jgi:hypothetical protein